MFVRPLSSFGQQVSYRSPRSSASRNGWQTLRVPRIYVSKDIDARPAGASARHSVDARPRVARVRASPAAERTGPAQYPPRSARRSAGRPRGARSRRGARGDDPPHRAAGLRHTRRLSRRHDRRGAGARDPLVCLSRRPHVVVDAAGRREASRRDPAHRGRGRGALHPPVPSRRRGDGGGLARPLPGDPRRRQGRDGGRDARRADLARHALAAALAPVVIGVALERAAVPLQSFLPPGMWARREGSPVLGGSRRAVKTLLAEGGWSEGLRPTLLVPSEASPVNLAKVAEAIRAALAAQSIHLALRLEPPDAARAILQRGDHDLALLEAPVTGGDPHLFLFPLSTSEAAVKGPRALNFSFYRNPQLDGLLVRASQLTFRSERQRLYQRAQVLLAQELPWLPIYVRLNWALTREGVRGLRLQPTGFHHFDTVTIEAPQGSGR